MSAPVSERSRAAVRGSARTTAVPAQRGKGGRRGTPPAANRRDGSVKDSTTALTPSVRKPVQKGAVQKASVQKTAAPKPGRTSAQQKAYARRDDRLRRLVGGSPARTAAQTTGRAKVVLVLMVMLAVGLVATLWLSTAAAADSYRLQDARSQARLLSMESERLHREVANMQSAPELAKAAAALGMVPVQDPARLVVGVDGAVAVVGEPVAAVAKAPPAPPAAAPQIDPVTGEVIPPAPAEPGTEPVDLTGGDATAGAEGAAGTESTDADSTGTDSTNSESTGTDSSSSTDSTDSDSSSSDSTGTDSTDADSTSSDSTSSDSTSSGDDADAESGDATGATQTGTGNG